MAVSSPSGDDHNSHMLGLMWPCEQRGGQCQPVLSVARVAARYSVIASSLAIFMTKWNRFVFTNDD